MLLLTYIKNIKFNKYTYFKRKGLFFMIKIIKMTIFRYYIRLAQKIKIYLAYSKIKFLNEIQYKIAAFAGVITQFAWGGMYIMLYCTFMKNGNADTYTIPQMCTYIWLHQAFFLLFNFVSVDKDILEMCKTGGVALELVKPIDLYYIWHAKTLGKKIAATSLRALPIFIICTMPFLNQYKLTAPVNIGAFFLFVITLILSLGLIIAYVMLLYIIVMKTTTTQGIKLTFQLVMEFCTGGAIPIAFMPNYMIKILKFTPFYYMENVSFNIYNGYISDGAEIFKIILLQLFWLTILTILGKKMMNKRLSKLIVQGG